eukprot:jgi/Ulvmu1/11068/UM007_0250.1
MDEPPPPGLEPEVYYSPPPQLAPAPIPTVYQPPPVPYIPPVAHPNPPVPEAPARVEVQREATPEPPKPRAPKPNVSVLQGGRKLALGTQKSNLASRLVARSSQQGQKSPHLTKQASWRGDGQPRAEAVFASSPPPEDIATDASPEAGIPEPVPAYPAHLERRLTSGSPQLPRSLSPRRPASPPPRKRKPVYSPPPRTTPPSRPMPKKAPNAGLLSQSDDDSDIDDRLVPVKPNKKPVARPAPPTSFPSKHASHNVDTRKPAIIHSASPSPPRLSAHVPPRSKAHRPELAIQSMSKSPPPRSPAPAPPLPARQPPADNRPPPSDTRKRAARRHLSEDDDEDDIAAVAAQSSPAGPGAAAKRRFRARASRSPPGRVVASPVASRSPSLDPKQKRLRAEVARPCHSPAPAHHLSPARGSPQLYSTRAPARHPVYHGSPRRHSAGGDLRFRERAPWPPQAPPSGYMPYPPPQAWGPPRSPPRHQRPPDSPPRRPARDVSRDLRQSNAHAQPRRSRTPSPGPRQGAARSSGGPWSHSPGRHNTSAPSRRPPRSSSPARYTASPPRRNVHAAPGGRSHSGDRAGIAHRHSYAAHSPRRAHPPHRRSASPATAAEPPHGSARQRSISRDSDDIGRSAWRGARADVSPSRRASSPHRQYSPSGARPQHDSAHASPSKPRGRGAVGSMRSAGAWGRSSSRGPPASRSPSPAPQRSRTPLRDPRSDIHMRGSGSPPRSPSSRRRSASPLPPSRTSPARSASPPRHMDAMPPQDLPSRSRSPHAQQATQRRRRGWDMSEGGPPADGRAGPPAAAPPPSATPPPHQPAAAVRPPPASLPQPTPPAATPPADRNGINTDARPSGPPLDSTGSTPPAAAPPAAAPPEATPPAAPTPKKKPPPALPHLHARRLQITGAPVSVSVPELERLLNRAMRAAGLSTAPGPPVIGASVRAADRSAHIELATPADTANAFALDGLMCRGMRLRFQRPPTFDLAKARQLGHVEPQRDKVNRERVAIVVDLLNNFPTRALADRLPTDMPADSVRSALQAVPGVMAATIMDLDAAGAPLAVAASATVDPAATDATAAKPKRPAARAAVVDISAVASLDAVLRSLNTLRVGGHPVVAARMAAPVEVVNTLQALEEEHEAHLLAAATSGDSAGVRLKGMLRRAAVEVQAAELQHDIAAVGRRYGDLLAVRMPGDPISAAAAALPAPPETAAASAAAAGPGGDVEMADTLPAVDGTDGGAPGGNAEWEGDVVLCYRSLEAAQRAAAALQGRTFDGRPLVAIVEGVH